MNVVGLVHSREIWSAGNTPTVRVWIDDRIFNIWKLSIVENA